MADSGVGAVRAVFSWARAEPAEGVPTDFAHTDALVADATAAGIDLLPIVMYAPSGRARDRPRTSRRRRGRRSTRHTWVA